MTQQAGLAWVLTGFVLLESAACSSDVRSVPDVTEDAAISTIALRVEGMT